MSSFTNANVKINYANSPQKMTKTVLYTYYLNNIFSKIIHTDANSCGSEINNLNYRKDFIDN